MSAKPRVAVVGPDLSGEIADIEVLTASPGALASVEADAALLDLRSFGSVAALLTARATFSGPALLVIAESELDRVLSSIRPEDEVCTPAEPLALLAHRLRRIVSARDPLTGLATRAELEREAARMLATASATSPVSLIFIDIDRFKAVNDEHGHAKGDEVLVELGALVRGLALPARVVARAAGDVIAVLLVGPAREAMRIADEMRVKIAERPLAGVAVRASAGVATVDAPARYRDLAREADEARYRAKARGRDRTVHGDDLERESVESGGSHLSSFEDFTRVIAERVADTIARRGRKIFAELREQADVDALTSLYSRRYLDRRLPFEVEHAGEADATLVFALLDLDHFGVVNKTHGWPSGDRVLARVAEIVRANVRASDWVARYGGEEICIVLSGTPLDVARTVLERVRQAVEASPFESTAGERITLTVSIGAAELASGELPSALVERASDRLLEAKRAGRNQLAL